MKKIIILLLVAIGICLFGYYALFGETDQLLIDSSGSAEDRVDNTTDQPAPEEPAVEPLVGEGSLEELRRLEQDLECVVKYEDEETQTVVEGTYFVSGGEVRGDFLTDTPDLSGQVLSSMIVTDSMLYTWTVIEGNTYGMKLSLTDVAAEDPSVTNQQPVPVDQPVGYECKPWLSVDRTVFQPPSDVLFQDYSELMQAGMQEGVLYEEGELLPELQ